VEDQLALVSPVLDRFRLDGRVALVTGGGQGIGRGFAHALGEAGASVAVLDAVLERAETVAHELATKGIPSLAVAADVTHAEQVHNAVQTTVRTFGRLTIGVNNAGIAAWADAETMSEAEWDRMLAVNLKGVFLCAQAEITAMRPAGYGKIINTASMSARIVNTPQNQAAYNASKAGVVHLTRSLAAEWAPFGVRVNSISPGYTRTELVTKFLENPEGKAKLPLWLERTPLGRLAEVSDLQGAVVYLASPASDFVTGHDLLVDGGYCIW